MSYRIALVLLLILSFSAIVQNSWYFPLLPDRVATHFDGSGKADGWMPKATATLTMCLFQIGMPLFMLGITWLAGKLPSNMVNIPNREYWLHADRRSATLAYMQTLMAWIAVCLSLFMMLVNHLTFVANREGENLQTSQLFLGLAVFMVVILCIVSSLLWRFRLPAACRQ